MLVPKISQIWTSLERGLIVRDTAYHDSNIPNIRAETPRHVKKHLRSFVDIGVDIPFVTMSNSSLHKITERVDLISHHLVSKVSKMYILCDPYPRPFMGLGASVSAF